MKKSLRIFKALGDRNRLRILKLLQHRDCCCVCEIVEVLGIGQSTTSRHLRILEEADLIYSSREGKWVNYRLSVHSTEPHAVEILGLLQNWMEDDPQVSEDRKKVQECDRNVLCSRCQ